MRAMMTGPYRKDTKKAFIPEEKLDAILFERIEQNLEKGTHEKWVVIATLREKGTNSFYARPIDDNKKNFMVKLEYPETSESSVSVTALLEVSENSRVPKEKILDKYWSHIYKIPCSNGSFEDALQNIMKESFSYLEGKMDGWIDQFELRLLFCKEFPFKIKD